MGWPEILILFLIAVASGVATDLIVRAMVTARGGIRSVRLVDGPWWLVMAGGQTVFVDGLGFKLKDHHGKKHVILMQGQRPWACPAPDGMGQKQAAAVRVEANQSLYFGLIEDVLAASKRNGAYINGAVIEVRAFVKVQGRRKYCYARHWCRYDWSTRKVEDR